MVNKSNVIIFTFLAIKKSILYIFNMIKANYEFLFTGEDENTFLENYYYDLLEEEGDNSGQIFINLEIQNNPLDAEEIGGVIFETFQKYFFEDFSAEPYDRFEYALKEVNNVLSEFKEQKSSGYLGNLNIIIGAVHGNDLFLAQCGDSEAYLIRKRYVSIISEGLSGDYEKNDDIFSTIASGKVESGDFVLFSSARILRYISKNTLAECVNPRSVLETLEEIKGLISSEILGKIGLTGILFKEEKEIMEDVKDEDSLLSQNTGPVKPRSRDKSLSFLKILFGWGQRFKEGLFSKGFGKDKILSLLVLVIIFLLVVVLITGGKRTQKEELARLDGILTEVQVKISEAETRGLYDKNTARDLLSQAYQDAKFVLDSGYYREKATMYLLEIEEARDKIYNVNRVQEPVLFADLSSKNENVNALGFIRVRDRVFVYEDQLLYEVVVNQVQDPVSINTAERIVHASGFDDRSSVLFLTRNGDVFEYREGILSRMNSEEGGFHAGNSISTWGNRMYILDSDKNQIWRYGYMGTRERFGVGEAYIGNNDEVNLSLAVDLAIDGSVYVLHSNGEIDRFYAGSLTDFFVQDMPTNLFKNPEVIHTNANMSEVFVLDGRDARVFVFKKDGSSNLVYQSQYVFEGVGDLRDLYFDQNSGKLYVLSANSILEVAI